jgi:hypothetical protein
MISLVNSISGWLPRRDAVRAVLSRHTCVLVVKQYLSDISTFSVKRRMRLMDAFDVIHPNLSFWRC